MVDQILGRSEEGPRRGNGIWLYGVVADVRAGENSCAVEAVEGDATRFESGLD